MGWEIDGYCYIPGQACPDKVSQNTKYKWDTMNKIYSTKNGKKAIDEMNVVGVMYNVSSESHPKAQDASGSYLTNGDGTGGTIYLNGNDNNIGYLAHEIFHGYQDLHGQGGASIYNEVEARLFANSICIQADIPFGNQLKVFEGQIPEVFNYNLDILNSNFSSNSMEYLTLAFKDFYPAYQKLPLKLPNQTSLIKSFYSLNH